MAKNNRPRQVSPILRTTRLLVWLLVLIMLALTSVYAWPFMKDRVQTSDFFASLSRGQPVPGTATPSPTYSLADAPSMEPSATPLPPAPSLASFSNQGLIILAIGEGGFTHLFAYQAQETPFIRLTDGPWHDITPDLSPDGIHLAFASDRNGQWDLYLMDLTSGEINRLTDTPEYDGSPSWSPDGRWLVYETYVDSEEGANLELFIRPLDGEGDQVRLTDDPAADHSPAWSPLGRRIAFVSTRSGDDEIWLADLDAIDERFQNISHNNDTFEAHPAWSPDGTQLAWASTSSEGVQDLYIWDSSRPNMRPYQVNSGDWFAWSPAGNGLLTSLPTPNRTYLTGYSVHSNNLILPLMALSGPVAGMTWGATSLPESLPASMAQAAQLTPTPLWIPALTPAADMPIGRQRIVSLGDVEAPNPMMQDLVDESFRALRERVIVEAGWDFLASLENAFLPFTSPPGPGTPEDWLYTGRAFCFNTAPINAGWVAVVREDYGPQTYWHIYLRTRYQDGSQGAPLRTLPWNLYARYDGDPRAYEQGGALETVVPPGYWLDFTRLAAAYGWERLPALNTWRLAYSTSRFNKFVMTSGLDWLSAMMEIYPREALNTTTPVPSPTNTPTITRTPTRTIKPTSTRWLSPTPSNTPTITPTRTPRPTKTPWPTRTPIPTDTPWWTLSPTFTPTPTPWEKYNQDQP